MTSEIRKTHLLKGCVRNLNITETSADLIFSTADRGASATTGLAAAALGLSGLAAAAASSSIEESKEPLKRAQFDLNGSSVEALLWDFPFNEGDQVTVVAEEAGMKYRAFAVANPEDRLIAVYPYATSGKYAFFASAVQTYIKFCAFILTPIFAFMYVAISSRDTYSSGSSLMWAAILAICMFALIGLNMSRKFFPFVRIAEHIFKTLDFPNPKKTNLRRLTRKLRRPDDPPALGNTYFRY